MIEPGPHSVHGGGLAAAVRRFGGRPGEWLDLSTGISPWPYQLPPFPPQAWQRLPEPETMAALVETAGVAYDCAAAAQIVPAPGSQALIQRLPELLRPGACAIVGPTYGEHATSWTRAGHRVDAIAAPDQVTDEHRVLVLGNPNNPDGRSWPPEALLAASAALRARGGLLVVDEAFADLQPELSLAPHLDQPGLCLLRSFGKVFGLAGVRLGFALCSPGPLAARLVESLGPWPVSGVTIQMGLRALADRDWINLTRARLGRAMPKLHDMLTAAGLEILGGTSLFVLVAAADGWALFEHLAKAQILTRPFALQRAWLRIGLPRDDLARGRLAEALASRP
jgi:cobalamin biosynthetic protein CobC